MDVPERKKDPKGSYEDKQKEGEDKETDIYYERARYSSVRFSDEYEKIVKIHIAKIANAEGGTNEEWRCYAKTEISQQPQTTAMVWVNWLNAELEPT